jgi:hypothetical protein
LSDSPFIQSVSTLLDARRGRFHPARYPCPGAEHPRGDRRLLGAQQLGRLPVGQPGDVDRHERIAELVRQGGDDREHLACRGGLLGPRGPARVGRLALLVDRLRGDAPGGLAPRAEERVPQHLEQIPEIVLVADTPRLGKDQRERLLDEVLGVRPRAGERPGGAKQAIDVIAQGRGIEHALRAGQSPRA